MKRVGFFLLYCCFSLVLWIADAISHVAYDLRDNWKLAGDAVKEPSHD